MTEDYTSSSGRTDGGTPGSTPDGGPTTSTAYGTTAGPTTSTAYTTTGGPSGSTAYTSTESTTGSTAGSTTDTAKEQATHLKEKAAGAGGQLLDDAKSEAAAVTHEARRQLDDLWSQARSELSGQASTQQSRLAGGLTSFAGQLNQMASAPSEQSLAADVVREIGTRADALGRWLEDHGPDEVLDEVRSFARRRPGTFLLVAAGAGVVLGRLTRGLKDATSSSPEQPARRTTSAPVQPVYTDPVEERPRFTDEFAAPVPTTAGWEQR